MRHLEIFCKCHANNPVGRAHLVADLHDRRAACPSTRELGDLIAGREPVCEERLYEVLLGMGRQTQTLRASPYLRPIGARALVRDRDGHLWVRQTRAQDEVRFGGVLKPVVDSVANDVHPRRPERFEGLTGQPHPPALDHDLKRPAALLSTAHERRPDINRRHPEGHGHQAGVRVFGAGDQPEDLHGLGGLTRVGLREPQVAASEASSS